jgi:hypothetical protein
VSLFGFCLLIGSQARAKYWRLSISILEVRIIFVKFLGAWPQENLLGIWDVKDSGRVGVWLDLGNWEWDVVLLLALFLHRQHLMRRGAWLPKQESLSWLESCRRIPLIEGMHQSRSSDRSDVTSEQAPGSAPPVASCLRPGVDLYRQMLIPQLLAFCCAPFLYADLYSTGSVSDISAQVN